MIKKKVTIGFDIGIASVGWCVTESETLKIIKHGVRTFNTVEEPKTCKLLNETRREKRSSRRQLNRRKVLKRDFIKLLIDEKIINDIKFDRNGIFVEEFRKKYINDSDWRKKLDEDATELGGIFNLRQRALTKKLENKEIINILYWYIGHRGFKYKIEDENKKETKKDKKDKKNTLDSKNQLDKKLPIEIQIDYFCKNGYLNGSLNAIFHQKHYLKEIDRILENQDNLSDDFKNKFINLFKRQRSFEIGPGGKNSPTEYGIFQRNSEGKIIKKFDNIWEKTIGFCTYYWKEKERRAPKYSLSAELFNLLNDLNNITVKINDCSKKLPKELKLKIINISLETKLNKIKIFKEIYNFFDLTKIDFDKISGFRTKPGISSDDVQFLKDCEITELKTFHKFNNLFKKINFEYDYKNLLKENIYKKNNLINKLSEIFSKIKTPEIRLEKLKKDKNNFFSKYKFTNEQLEEINKLNIGSGTHNFSFKTLDEFIQIMIEENKNQMQIIHENKRDLSVEKFNLKKNIILSTVWIDSMIITPTVKRSLYQTVKIFNSLTKLCKLEDLEIENIVIEMAREKNLKDKKDIEKNIQKYNADLNKQIEGYIENMKVSNTLKLKIWLCMQQKEQDVYTGQEIIISDLMSKHFNYQIDHIIPYNQSFNNSRNNRVLTLKDNNHEKSDRTPKQYLNKKDFQSMSEKWKDWYSFETNKNDRKAFFSKKKLDYLMTNINFSIPENQVGFIGRNLVDTRYITKSLLELLNAYKKINNLNFKLLTVNGKMTSFVRKTINFYKEKELINPLIDKGILTIEDLKKDNQKNRTWHGHHAQDAYFITVLSKWYKQHKIIEKYSKDFFFKKFDLLPSQKNNIDLKEFVDKKKFYSKFDELKLDIIKSIDKLNNNLEDMLFSRKIEKKTNLELFNETLYKSIVTENINQLQKIVYKKLIEFKKEDCNKYFDPRNEESKKVIIKNINPKMYKQLCKIFESNANEPFPFKKEMEKHKKNSIICFIKNKEVSVKKVQILKELKNKSDVIIVNDKNSFYDSMKWIKILVYKDNKKKYRLIPINALNAKFTENKVFIDEIKLNIQKEKLNINKNSQPTNVLFKGDIVQDQKDGEFYYVVGNGGKSNTLELKPIKYNDKKRIFISINSKIINKIKFDYLGNIIKSFSLFK